MLWYRWVPLFRLRRQWGWEGFGPLDSLNSDQKRVAVLVKCDEKEARPAPAGTRSHPAFCYSAAALHGNRKTPASSLIHDLPFQKKKKKLLSRIICVFFFKLGVRSSSICFRACIQAVGNVAGCCQVTKALPSTGSEDARRPPGGRHWCHNCFAANPSRRCSAGGSPGPISTRKPGGAGATAFPGKDETPSWE